MNLSLRLQAILELVDNNSIVLDIGCDHAYLPISLVLNNKSIKAYALDNKVGPLNNASKNIEDYNLNNKVFTVLSDGFKDLKNNDYTTVTISGMGALNIIDILNNAKKEQLDNKVFIFEANRDNDILREYLMNNGYSFVDERIVFEDNIYYFVIKCIKNNLSYKLKRSEIEFGPINIKKKDPLLKSYIEKLINIYDDALKNANNDNFILKDKINNLKEALYEIK